MSEHRWVVDAIEEKTASIEVDGKTMIAIPASLLPKGVRAGHVLKVSIQFDEDATGRAEADSVAQVKRGRDASRKRDPGGNISL
jgi:hypothetical protein